MDAMDRLCRSSGPGGRLVMRVVLATVMVAGLTAGPGYAGWRVLPPHDQRQPLPKAVPPDATTIQPKDKWPNDEKFRWLIGDLVVPETIEGQSTSGRAVGLQFNCGDGGEVYVDDQLQTRYDNDHPALVLVAEQARPTAAVHVAVQVYGRVQGGDTFGEATWVIVDPKRAASRLALTVDPRSTTGEVPNGIVGLSQGGGLADYDDATARRLKEGGFKWFRMDNVFTGVVRETDDAQLAYDWSDFDRRVDFIVTQMGAEPIFAVSYMPAAFDAIPDGERHSAPCDYGLWEDLCYRAAKHSLDRGKRIPFWEVWNEANAGWIKPGLHDTGRDLFKKLYAEAIGKEPTDQEVVRTFEAYCKLYRATARGVKRADPKAKVGGPALASGPFEAERYGHCRNGQGFARGLMLWCRHQSLPLDFVSWHEYFHPAEVLAAQADAFRQYLQDFPEFRESVQSFMVTEWNEAWWADRPQDHEIGAAWCADCIVRAFLPHRIDRPCFFYVKQNDMNFRGDYSLLMANNVPKASYNVAKIFNGLSGKWIAVTGTDDEVCAVAAWDADRGRLAIVLVNFRYRHALRRHVQVRIDELPAALAGGSWTQWVVDATHSNVWHDPQRAELTQTQSGRLTGTSFIGERTLPPNSVTLIELLARPAGVDAPVPHE